MPMAADCGATNGVSAAHVMADPAAPTPRRDWAIGLALCLAATVAAPAAAQDGWSYTATFSAWLPGLQADVATPFGPVRAELDFGEVWDALDMAAFASLEANKGPWSIVGDLVFADLGATQATPFGVLFQSADVDTRLTLVSTYVAHSVLDDPGARVDIGAGLRFADASVDVLLLGNVAPTQTLSFSDSWVDPILGIRARFDLGGNWFANGYADVGGFGIGNASEMTWQGYVGLGYRFNETWSMQAGYRHLEIDRSFDLTDIDLQISGVMIGMQASF